MTRSFVDLVDEVQEVKQQAAVTDVSPLRQSPTEQSGATNADRTSPELDRVPSVEEIARPTAKPGGKRAGGKRAGDDSGAGSLAQANKQRRGGNESNLTANYNIPKDATPIRIDQQPKYDSREDFRPPPQGSSPRQPTLSKMSGYRGTRGHQPMNTLGHSLGQRSSIQTGRDGAFASNSSADSVRRVAVTPGNLTMLKSAGANVQPAKGASDDDHGLQGLSRKRQKVSHNDAISKTRAVSAINEDAISDIPTTTEACLRESTPKGGQVHVPRHLKQDQSLDRIFQRNEQYVVDRELSFAQEKKQRCASIGRNYRSKNSTPEVPHHQHSAQGTKQQPVAVDDDEDTQAQATSKGTVTIAAEPNGNMSRWPQIDLMRDMDKIEKQHHAWRVKQGSVADIKNANQMLIPNQNNGSQRTTRRSIQQGNAEDDESFEHHKPRVTQKQPLSIAEDGPLRYKFRPDDSHIGSRTRPQVDATPASAAQIEFDTEDELAGERTIIAWSSQKPSSRKAVLASPRRSTQVKHGQQKRDASPSDIRATEFKHSGHKSRSSPQIQLANTPEFQEYQDDNRILIKSIFCKAYISVQEGAELVWHEKMKVFFVHVGSKKVFPPGINAPLIIGKADVSHKWTANRTSLKAMLTGSASSHSNGKMLIEFNEEKGLLDCYQLLLSACNPAMITDFAKPDIMNKTYDKQRKELIEAHDRFKEAAMRELERASIRKPGFEDRRGGSSEEIQYEQRGPERRPKASIRMQGQATMANTVSGEDYQELQDRSPAHENISRYFEPRRSTRQNKPVQTRQRTPTPVPKWTAIHKPPQWKHPVVYPTQGLRRVTVDFTDLERLDEGEFLNDNVVNFELRYIEEHMRTEDKKKVHFFNTFFYSALSSKAGKRVFNYDSVKRWTKNVDIFTVPYVVVPINADLHWFVAIICNLPALERICSAFDIEASSNVSVDESHGANRIDPVELASQDTHVAIELDDETSFTSALPESHNSDLDTVDNVGDTTLGDSKKIVARDAIRNEKADTPRRKGSKKRVPALPKYNPHAPIIISMDSFGMSRSTELRYLKQYVSKEAEMKRGIDYDWHALGGMTAKGLPEQPNFSDCGLYLCEYVAEFAKDPDRFVTRILQREMQSEEFCEFNPSAKRDEIRKEILNLHHSQDIEREAHKKAKAATAKHGQAPKAPTTPVMTEPNAAQRTSTSATLPAAAQSSQLGPAHLPDKPTPSISRQSTPSHRMNGRPLGDDDGDEMEIEPPYALGGTQGIWNDDESDEMLDGTDDEDTQVFSDGESSERLSSTNSDEVTVDSAGSKIPSKSPVLHGPRSDAKTEAKDEQRKHDDTPEQQSTTHPQRSSKGATDIIDLEDEEVAPKECQPLSPEISKSQERHGIAQSGLHDLEF